MLSTYKKIAASVALSLSCALPAFATAVTYNLSGVLTDIRGSGVGLSFGTPFAAQLSFDDAPAAGTPAPPNRAYFSNGQFSAQAGPINFVGGPTSTMIVSNDWTDANAGFFNVDGVYFYSLQADATGYTLIQIDTWDMTGQLLQSLDVPSHAQVKQLTKQGWFFFRRFDLDFTETGFAGGGFLGVNVDGPQEADVPEPATVSLMLLGLLGVGLTRHKRKQARA